MSPSLARCAPLLSNLARTSTTPLLASFANRQTLFAQSKKIQLANMSEDAVQKSWDNTKAEYVRLGNSGLKVSIPILGAMSFGHPDWASWVIEEEQALPILKAAYDKGLNTWDTANMYSAGVSEEIIGKALKKYDIPRHKVFILTKCFITMGEKPSDKTMSHSFTNETKDWVNQGGLSRGAIFKAVDASLRRLNTPYIDLLQIHRFDKNTPIEETMEALNDIVRSGKVHYIGASSMFAYQFAQMQFCAEKHGWTKFISMQNHYSLLYREEEREMNKYCRETGVGLIPWGPLYSGMLARPMDNHGSTVRSQNKGKASDMQQKIVGRVQELAEKKGWKMSQVALAWIKTKTTSPIVGFSSIARMDEALEVRGKELTADEIKYLEEPYEAQPIQGHS